ncbi:FAD-binding domain-containing protein [Melanogaster broomeanus]|nr:FAD-binding domain-containing protein [Melanogaster broomeanus]
MALNGSSTVIPGSPGIQGIVLYPAEPYLILTVVLLVVGCFQWGDEESMPASTRGTSVLSLPLAVVNSYRTVAFRTTVGVGSYIFNMAEVFAALAYVALLFIWTYLISSNPDGEPLNWCSRAGLLSASQFPFITILGTKNNIVSLITGIGPDKLNYMHRLTARACLVLVGIHALGGTSNFSFTSKLFGIVAGLAFGALALVSLRPIREWAYELFFYVHFIAVIVIMLATILHINDFRHVPVGISFTYYIWPAFIIWALDRLIRTARLIYYNLAYFTKKSGTMDATTELLSDKLVRVRFRRPSNFHWSPGQFAYLIMPSVSKLPFEAHPFSISSVDSTLFAPEARALEGDPASPYQKELVFLIGVRNGFTRRLKDIAARRETVKVYVDGPYGDAANLGCYDTSLLIAASVYRSVRNGSSRCRRVVLIWSIRDADFLQWIVIRIFLTSGALPNLPASTAALPNPFEDQNTIDNPPNPFDVPEEPLLSTSWLKMVSGRPNLKRILEDEINSTTGRLSVSVCGPNAMARVVRNALRLPWSGPALNGGPSVTLHVESFGYA